MASGDSRQNKSTDCYCVRVIKGTHFGEYLQPDRPIARDGAGEFQLDTERLELNRDRRTTCHAGHNRVRQLSTRKKTCGLAVSRQQIRFGEDLQDVFLLEGLNRHSQVEVRPKEKD